MSALPIVDAHQHFWDLDRNYLPWLGDEPPIPFRYGDYSALKRNYLPADYRRDTAGFEIAATVFVETEWDPNDSVGETRWVHELAAREGLPSAMVCQAWLDRDGIEEVLAAQSAFPLVRGIRHKPRAARSPAEMSDDLPGSMTDPKWRRGFAQLRRHGLSFDLQTPWWHFRQALDLAEAFPETEIIVNHTGLPADRSDAGLTGWREAMALLARAPNVAVKVSGLGVPGRPWTADSNCRVVLDAIELFGVDRAMFASNFPVDGLVASFRTIYDGFFEITEGFSADERRKLFHDNALKFYRIAL
ncbi:MAG: amidohydrolase family protein [Propylenella sp.]